MRLGLETNGKSNELMMQDKFETWIKNHNEIYTNKIEQNSWYKKFPIQYHREVHISEVNRSIPIKKKYLQLLFSQTKLM